MVEKFQSDIGRTYSLLGCVASDPKQIREYDIMYHDKAMQQSQISGTHVFYSLKKFKSGGTWDFAQYFIAPITQSDVEKIPLLYPNDWWFGIVYNKSVPDISYEEKLKIRQELAQKDIMTGLEYEHQCAEDLRRMGFYDIEVTRASGDQGIDVIAFKDGLKYGIQCKYYSSSVSNSAVQEAYSGAKYYGCDIAVVMTNSTFTESAKELAHTIGVKLWSSATTYKEV